MNPKMHTSEYLKLIGVAELPALTSPFDPGYDPATLESHLDQSAHLMSILKISMACWMIADEKAIHRRDQPVDPGHSAGNTSGRAGCADARIQAQPGERWKSRDQVTTREAKGSHRFLRG